MLTVSVLPAVSLTVTVTLAVLMSAVSGVPLITPVVASMLSPGGRPAASYPLMSAATTDGLISSMGSPTCAESGAVYVVPVGAVRSTGTVRCSSGGAVNPLLEADTVTATLVPAM